MDFSDLRYRFTYYDQPRLGDVQRSVDEAMAEVERIRRNDFSFLITDRATEHFADLPPRRLNESLIGFGLIALWCVFLLWI